MITKEQEAALQELVGDTHCFWSPEAAIKLTTPFGFKCRVHVHEADGGPHNPKGLVLDNGRPHAAGASSWDISAQIAGHYNLRPEGKMGRGFQVQADCKAIREHLNGK